MASKFEYARAYCSDHVKANDEDRWLAAQYAPAKDCRRLLALYALQCELRRIPSLVSEPPLGEIRLQWWREALHEIHEGGSLRAHPVVEEFAEAGLAHQRFAPMIERVIDANARALYGEGFADIADLTDWLALTDGAIDAIAVQLLGGDDALASHAAHAGSAFALAREGRALAPALADAIGARAVAIAIEAAPILQKAAAKTAPALLHISLTRLYARHGAKSFALYRRARLFAAMAFGRF